MNSKIKTELVGLGFLDEATLDSNPALLGLVTRSDFLPGEVIYHHGGASKMLFLIREGLVKLLAHLPNGQSRIVRLHKPGSMIGMDGLMDQIHQHSAIAINDVCVFQIPHTELLQLREKDPQAYTSLLEKWHEYLGYADTWITDFSTGKIRARVARLVRFLARFDEETGPQIVELLTTEEMSEILGVTPESVSRVVAEFKREDILKSIEKNSESLFSYDLGRLRQETHD